MEKKFTEGKWVIDKKRDTVCIDILCNDEVVATCWDDYDCVDQLRANAKLIAAAPELIEILIKMCEFHEKNATWDKGDNGYYEAKRIIKKATE